MKREGDKVILSASDLMRFQGCWHATTLDLRWLRRDEADGSGAGDEIGPVADDEGANLLQAKGDAHERRFLEELKSGGIDVAEIETKRASFEMANAMTLEALRAGKPIIFQAALKGGAWAGFADFLQRVERRSLLGGFSYEVIDTKLKRTPAPSHVLQLALYSDLLAEVQGRTPEHIHVKLGDGRMATLRLADYIHYARRLRRRLEAFVADPPETRSDPCVACGLCRWRERCEAEWEKTENLCLVAGIRRGQRMMLEAAGVTTLAQLAKRTKSVPELSDGMLCRLRDQARLQHARRQGGKPAFELRETEEGRGLARMTKPAKGDLFFDMEGDPLIEGGLEYLFGIYDEVSGETRFTAFWAHDHAEEAKATGDVLAFFDAHLRAYPDAYIYHYNHYEVTALKRLASKHAQGELILDQLLRGKRFVDLYRVVSEGIIASEPGYSLKNLEAFYAQKRDEDVKTAGDSIVVYEKWRETKDPDLLEGIRAYNEFDCRSTKGLRDWLVRDVRPKQLPWAELSMSRNEHEKRDARTRAEDAEREAMRTHLRSVHGAMAGEPADLLFELMWYHRREDKPQWWAMFDRAERETQELIDDLDCLAGLEAVSKARPEARSLVRRYRYPEQETKLREGAQVKALIEGLPSVSVFSLHEDAREVEVKFGPKAGPPPTTLDLIPQGPISNEVLRTAIARVAENVFAGGRRYAALEAALARQQPSVNGVAKGQPLIAPDAEIVSATVSVVTRLKTSYLPIQGPPGTGKTYVASHAILALLKAGKRVAVTSHSHKAIDNLLLAITDRAQESRFKLKAIKKTDDGDELEEVGIAVTSKPDDVRLTTAPLVGGTAWLFSREEHDQAFDYLIVDEAGQFSLANLVAAGACAKNLVLVGDPMQLAQPVQGVHPGQSGASSLCHVLGDTATVKPERGIFLPVSLRMHPAICRYISDVVYDGRLSSHPDAARQMLAFGKRAAAFPPAGLCFLAVDHEGNSQSSREEAEAVLATFEALKGQTFVDREGKERKLGLDDILVVAPYNAQVNLLARTLPAGVRVGTVDKFQGQEAPVCIVSMATSSAEEMPRNIEFLFSVNRLNVAISRAQALSIVIASPRLLDVPCSTIEQMRLVNALCAVESYSVRMEGI
jgi:uncharacterized protein